MATTKQANPKQATFRKYLTIFIVALAGGVITKLPYLRETYMEPEHPTRSWA